MRNLSISAKLWLAVGYMMVAMCCVLTFAALRTSALRADAAQRTSALDQRLALASDWRRLTDGNVVRNMALMLSDDTSLHKVFKADSTRVIEEINGLQKQIESLNLSQAEKAALDQVAAERKRVLDIRKAIIDVRTAGDAEKASAMVERDFLPQRDKYIQALNAFVGLQQQALVDLREDLAAASRRTVLYSGLGLIIVLGMIVAGAAYLIRSIRIPLLKSVKLAEAIANGDLTQSISTDRQDEFGQLTLALSHMNDSLGKLVSQVHQASESIQTASAEVAAGTQDLAQRTEAAGSNLEMTASSMAQLTATVKQSADAARQANQLATTSADVAARGGQVVSQVVSTMDDINHSSRQIADIVGVIDGIAFQTNILALNAAVEAARAGESGRGFAVVAGEVRNLAQRSAQAAKEIKGLITTSVEKVQSGSLLVKDAGDTMGEIVASVQRVTDIIGEITAAAVEQSEGIAQVNVTVNQLDQMTQQNAALVEQSTAAAESLRDQAHRLIEVVSVFRVSGQAHLKPATTRPAPGPRPAPSMGALPPPASHARAAAPQLVAHAATSRSNKTVANKPYFKSDRASKDLILNASPSTGLSAGAPKRPAPARAPVGAGKSAASTAVAKTADDSGDWETF
ncbi:MAG: MCP four helix bundle domain-containing protein [Burkholderiales bacterium]|nr:MCP four helix bundle domain-containing protein [Burkholderiales bacterium]